ncbi:MAG: hypothetical protein K2X55_28520 [Burkholderiaceae bacterium]|nr:hypothetical protein [Burkholderiaceae bacterium]
MNTTLPLQRPASIECRTVLADGRVATMTASRRARANRAEVKCAVAGSPVLAARMQQVVRLARHTETRFDSREQVVLSLDCLPPEHDRGWELAAVLADRMARGVWHPGKGVGLVGAHGWSDAWHQGTAITSSGSAAAALAQALPGMLLMCGVAAQSASVDGGTVATVVTGAATPGVLVLPHLGALAGHTDPSAATSTARAWFPLHSGGVHDTLAWVEVSVAPLLSAAQGCEEEDTIAVPELNAAGQLAVRQALAAARHFDGRALGRWRTVVRFSETRFQGNSYELALVMADRLARGREFVPRGRLIATGCSGAWHAGRVDAVRELEAKLALIAVQAAPGDRILVPESNLFGAIADTVLADVRAAIQARGASMARIARIGMI